MDEDREEREARAEREGRALIELVRPQLPTTLPRVAAADAWRLVGPALIARQAGTLEAILCLRPLDREADPTILGRSLYEHAVTFAWLAADPGEERHQRFLRSDLKRRLKIDKDCRKLTDDGVQINVLTPAERQGFEQQLANLPEGTKEMPDLIGMATGADERWTRTIQGLAGSDTAKSFRGFYALAYRHESTITHATMLGLNLVIEDLDGGAKRVQLEERQPDSHGPFGRATLMFAFSLLIAVEALPEWPSQAEINSVFEGRA